MVFAQKYIAQLTLPKGEQKAHIQRYMVDLYFATVVFEHDNVPKCIYWKTEVMFGGRAR